MRYERRFGVRTLVGVAVVAALVGAACGKKATPAAGSSSPAATSGHAGGYGGGYGGGTSTSPPATQSGGGGTVAATVTQVDFQFTPSTVTVTKGDTIAVTNGSPSTPHTFTIEGKGIDVENDSQGQTTQVKIDLAPGTYGFICRFHVSQGMKGTLIVK